MTIINGVVNIHGGNPIAVPNNYMQIGSNKDYLPIEKTEHTRKKTFVYAFNGNRPIRWRCFGVVVSVKAVFFSTVYKAVQVVTAL